MLSVVSCTICHCEERLSLSRGGASPPKGYIVKISFDQGRYPVNAHYTIFITLELL